MKTCLRRLFFTVLLLLSKTTAFLVPPLQQKQAAVQHQRGWIDEKKSTSPSSSSSSWTASHHDHVVSLSKSTNDIIDTDYDNLGDPSIVSNSRRDWLLRVASTSSSIPLLTMMMMMTMTTTIDPSSANAVAATTTTTTTTTTISEDDVANSGGGDASNMFAPKFVQEYPDFIRAPQGWSYRDVIVPPPSSSSASNPGKKAQIGDRVVFDWSGYTIGYFGRPFQAKGGPQGGAFEQQDVDYERTVLGSGRMIPGLEQALVGMTAGSVRQVLIPYGPLSYPPTRNGDGDHRQTGPTPTTFSGQRALNFVLDNPRIDRTLLFNVKVIRIDSPNSTAGGARGGGFIRGGL